MVEVPQEPIACPTKQDVYVLELQHGFCRDYLKNNKNYQELHRYGGVLFKRERFVQNERPFLHPSSLCCLSGVKERGKQEEALI